MTGPPHPLTFSTQSQRSRAEAEGYLRSLSQHPAVQAVVRSLAPADLFLVGGTVRDAFGATTTTDLDLATPLPPQEVKHRCETNGVRIIETGIQHGTVLAVVENTHLEITTFRVPTSRDSHQPASDIVTDLSGRDFTINALAFDLATLALIDPFGGIADLEAGIVRAVNDPHERFVEDPLRILRMIRFGDAHGRTIDSATLDAARKNVELIANVSHERIKTELDRIFMSAFPHRGLRTIQEIGALQFTIPELIPAIGFEQNKFHIHDVFEHTLWVLERTPPDLILRWSAVFHDIGKPHTLSVDPDGSRHFYSHETVSEKLSKNRMKELRFSTDDTRTIASIVRHHMRPLDCGAAGVRRLIRDLGDELTRWRQFKAADSPPTIPDEEFSKVASRFDALLTTELQKREKPSYGKLAVTGDDLLAFGLKPGPRVGALLKELEELVIEDPERNTKEHLLAEAKRRLR